MIARAVLCVAIVACGRQVEEAPTTSSQPVPLGKDNRRAAVVEQVGYVGVLTPKESVEVTSPLTSSVKKLQVKLGDTVTAGQALAILDDRPVRDELQIARVALKEASIAAGAASSRYAMEARALRAGVASRASVEAAKFDASQAAATVEQHRTKITQLEARLKDMRLVASIGGKVALRYVEEGARVTEGQPILRLISSSELFVKFAIPGDDARKLTTGDAIEIRFDGKPARAGTVKSVAPELDPIAQMIVAEAELAGSTADLQPGVVCRIVATKKPAATM